MNKSELLKAIIAASGQDGSNVVEKTRRGRQIKANALFEGSSSPASPRTPLGIFFSTDSTHLAHEGAIRRLSMDFPFPDAVVVLNPSDKECSVYGYDDGSLGVNAAEALQGAFHPVTRPAIAREAKPAGNLSTHRLKAALSTSPNVILQGPPGTGKSTVAMELIREIASSGEGYTSENCRLSSMLSKYDNFEQMISDATSEIRDAPVVWEMVQLHPSYSYDDLVRRLIPITKGGSLAFQLQDQLLPKICQLAEIRNSRPVVLILDEINRADLATVLGECLFAIDRTHRGEAVRLQYQDGILPSSIRVPQNLWVIGTMNTADRSISLLDYAVRRRFSFLEIAADSNAIRSWYAADPKKASLACELFEAVNEGLPASHMVGHSAFLVASEPSETWCARLTRKFAYHVAPLLAEYESEGLRGVRPVMLRGMALPVDEEHLDLIAITEHIAALVESD